MKLLAAVFRQECLLQWRSPRFRMTVPLYAGLASAPVLALHFGVRAATAAEIGGAAYLAEVLETQPVFTALLVALVVGNRSGFAAQHELWPVLSSASLTSAGHLLRRWLALVAILLPISMLPQLVALGLALAGGTATIDPATWVATWALQVLPVVLILSAFWLGLVTILGGEIGAALVTFLGLPALVGGLDHLLLRWRLTLSGYDEWLGYRMFTRSLDVARMRLSTPPGWDDVDLGIQATEAPFDHTAAVLEVLPVVLPAAGGAAFFLGLAASFARRTRRDLPPRKVSPEHPLRNFVELAARHRQRWSRDGGLGAGERLMAVLGTGVLLGCLAVNLGWQKHFQDLAGERYRVEAEVDFDPMAPEIRPLSWSFEGSLHEDGSLAVQTAGRLENGGAAPRAHLAFEIRPSLRVERLEVSGRRVTVERAWDRLRVGLEPPLAPGEVAEIVCDVRGRPERHVFPLDRGWSFFEGFQRFRTARFPRDVNDFSRSRLRRAISRRRVELLAVDLGPVPRHTPWTLIPAEDGDDPETGDWGPRVPAELDRTVTGVSVSLSGPADWFLATSCGPRSRPEGGRAVVAGTCRTALRELLVTGGAMEPAVAPAGRNEVVFAALRAHRGQAGEKAEAFARVASLSERAWPGLPGLEGLVAIEWPPPFHRDLRRGFRMWEDRAGPELHGRLLLIPERSMVSSEPLQPENLVAQMMSRDLLARRPLLDDQQVLFRHLISAVMLRRMGLGGERGATVSGTGWVKGFLRRPILEAGPTARYTWRMRLPAVLVEVESRVGSDHFFAGLESFLAGGDEPGTVEELFAGLEGRTGVSLAGIYRDHFQGKAMPELQLEGVRSLRRGERWTVEGALRNLGTGESVCPVVVKTEVGEHQLIVTVGSESSSPFETSTTARPHTLLLDPQRTCYRFQTRASRVHERINLLAEDRS